MKPEDIAYKFAEYWNERNARGIASLFVEDADFVNVVGIWWENKEDIFKAHRYGLRVIFNKSDLKVTKTKVRKISEEIYMIHARMRLTGQSSIDGHSQPGTRFNIFSFLVKRQSDEGFLALSAHNTDIVPGKETNMNLPDGTKSVDYREK